MELRELRAVAHAKNPVVQVGKLGVTEAIMAEINVQLSKKKIVKIRLLKTAKEDVTLKHLARDLATKLNAQLVQQVGNTITLYRS